MSNLKNELVEPEEFTDRAKGPNERAVAEAYVLYQRRLKEAHALDFDDIIMATVHLLQSHPHVAEAYRRRFRHVLVDEYQDTNHAQYMLVKELVGPPDAEPPPAELCVVGDADQSIYAFRGATIRNILEFERDYPERAHDPAGAELPLHPDDPDRRQRGDRPQHRRASPSGCGATRAPASRSSATSPTPSTPRPTGWPARSTGCTTARAYAPGDVAVFYRTNAQSRVFEEVFIRVGLPYKVVGGVRFYERKEVRDALAYLRAIVNDDDTVSIRRVLNTPRRGIGDRAEACVEALSTRDRISFGAALRRAKDAPGISTRAVNSITEFVALLDDLREKSQTSPPEEILEAVLPALRSADRAGGEHRPAGRRAGWKTCRSWSASPGSTPSASRRRPPRTPTRRAPPWPASWSRSRWSPTPTRSPATTRSTRAWSR